MHDHNAVEYFLVTGTVQTRKSVRKPRDAVCLSTSRRVLDQVVSSCSFALSSRYEFPDCIELMAAGKIIASFVTQRCPLLPSSIFSSLLSRNMRWPRTSRKHRIVKPLPRNSLCDSPICVGDCAHILGETCGGSQITFSAISKGEGISASPIAFSASGKVVPPPGSSKVFGPAGSISASSTPNSS